MSKSTYAMGRGRAAASAHVGTMGRGGQIFASLVRMNLLNDLLIQTTATTTITTYFFLAVHLKSC